MLGQGMKWLLSGVTGTIDAAWKLLTATLFHLPDVSTLPEVQILTERSLTVVNTCYGLGIGVAGLLVMAQPAMQSRTSAGELLPRLVIGLVAANFAVTIFQVLVHATNALVLGLTGGGIASTISWARLLGLITAQLSPSTSLLMAVIGLVLCVLVVLLVVSWITRFFSLILLCGIGPVALACHGSTWSDALAQAWWRAMGAVCLTVLLQAVVMNVGLAVLLDPASARAGLALPADPKGLLLLLIVLVLLWTTIRVPAFVRTFLSQRAGGRPSVLGTIVRIAVVQQVTRGLTAGAGQGVSRMVGAALGGRGRRGPGRPTPGGPGRRGGGGGGGGSGAGGPGAGLGARGPLRAPGRVAGAAAPTGAGPLARRLPSHRAGQNAHGFERPPGRQPGGPPTPARQPSTGGRPPSAAGPPAPARPRMPATRIASPRTPLSASAPGAGRAPGRGVTRGPASRWVSRPIGAPAVGVPGRSSGRPGRPGAGGAGAGQAGGRSR